MNSFLVPPSVLDNLSGSGSFDDSAYRDTTHIVINNPDTFGFTITKSACLFIGWDVYSNWYGCSIGPLVSLIWTTYDGLDYTKYIQTKTESVYYSATAPVIIASAGSQILYAIRSNTYVKIYTNDSCVISGLMTASFGI